MPDNRDYRIRIDITLPPTAVNYADQIREALLPFIEYAKVINEGLDNEERGFISIERCGHRIGVSCDQIARWEVGKGRVL